MIDGMIAIDFGTARTKVAYFKPATQTVELMYLGEDDKPFIPSYVGKDPTNEDKILVGETAVDLLERGVGIVTDAIKRAFLVKDKEQSNPKEELNDLPRRKVWFHSILRFEHALENILILKGNLRQLFLLIGRNTCMTIGKL